MSAMMGAFTFFMLRSYVPSDTQ